MEVRDIKMADIRLSEFNIRKDLNVPSLEGVVRDLSECTFPSLAFLLCL